MSRIIWDTVDKRRYEAGIDRGVLYPMDGGAFPWNGLASVDESYDGGELTTYAADGITFLANVSDKTYQANIKAYSSPKEFDPCVGYLEVKPGFILTRQQRAPFNFSYRTMINEVSYKLHVLYNVLASPTSRSYATTNDTPTAVDLEWQFAATPVLSEDYRPTAHFVIDSTKFESYSIRNLEDHLYGTEYIDPFIPTPESLMQYLLADPDVILEPLGVTI